MVRLYIKNHSTGEVHEYGTSPYDSLTIDRDGKLSYQNTANFGFMPTKYSFCYRDGTNPLYDADDLPFDSPLDVGGEGKHLDFHNCMQLIRACKDIGIVKPDPDNQENILVFLTYGFYAIFRRWLMSGCKENIESLTQTASALTNRCIKVEESAD